MLSAVEHRKCKFDKGVFSLTVLDFTLKLPKYPTANVENGLISYLKLVKLTNNIDNDFMATFLNPHNVQAIFKRVESYENSNILHNAVK